MTRKKIISFVIFCALALNPAASFALTGNAAIDTLNKQIEEKQARVKELEQSMNETKKTIEKKQLESVSLKNQISIISNRIIEVDLDIQATTVKLDELSLRISALGVGIADKEKIIEREKKIIAELLRNLAYKSSMNDITILASYSNFSDFYAKLQAVETVNAELAENTRALRDAKDDLLNQKQQAEDIKRSYDDLAAQLANKKQDLTEQNVAKQDLLSEAQTSARTYTALLLNLKKQYQGTETEVSRIEQEVRRRLEEQNKLPAELDPAYAGLFSWPVPSRYITTYFHDPGYPFRHIFEHSGIDIRASQGTAVYAAGAGYIARAKHCATPSCYSYVTIVHTSGLSTVYGHLSGIAVTENQYVARGALIGYSGATPGTVGAGPFVTGPHLHFEVRKDGVPVNPLGFLVK